MSDRTHKIKLLVADDAPNILQLMSYNLQLMGYEVVMARDGEETLKELKRNEDVQVILLDINMPKMDGLQTLPILKERYPHIPVIMVTALYEVKNAVKAIKMGAYEYIGKPVDFDLLGTVIKNALNVENLKHQVQTLEHDLHQNELFSEIIGASEHIKQVFRMVEKVMHTNVNVLIIGESGTGKELLARAIHKGSSRTEGPFVTVNCAAITSQLAESLLFGHKKGAFTGAHADSIGFFEQANGGTIFLDEIGDMPLDIQVKVLRVLEDKKIQRVGERETKNVDFRVIAATNRDLADAVADGEFREDLYFRLEEYPVFLPPLRNRKSDIPALAAYFLNDLVETEKLAPLKFSKDAMHKLVTHPWPGNIRELKNVVKRSALMAEEGIIQNIRLTQASTKIERNEEKTTEPTGQDVKPIEEMEKEQIERAYLFADKNAAEAARLLGISRATMYRKLKTYQVE